MLGLNYLVKRVDSIFILGLFRRKGKNFSGRICVKHRGGGNLQRFHPINHFLNFNKFVVLLKIFIDIFRTTNIGLIVDSVGIFNYILLADSLYQGSTLYLGKNLPIDYDFSVQGSTTHIVNISTLSIVSNIESIPGKGANLCRSAGVGGLLISKKNGFILLKLNSG